MTILYLTMSWMISLMRSVRELRMSWEAERWKTHARLKLQGADAWPSGLAASQGVPSKWVPLRWFLYPNGSGNWDRSAMGGAGGLAPAQSQPCRTWSPGTEPNALEVWGGGIRSPKQCGQSRCTPTNIRVTKLRMRWWASHKAWKLHRAIEQESASRKSQNWSKTDATCTISHGGGLSIAPSQLPAVTYSR